MTAGVSRSSHQYPATSIWVDQLPLRWARNAAEAALVFGIAVTMQPFHPKAATDVPVIVITLLFLVITILGYCLGAWARWSLRSRFDVDATQIGPAIPATWTNGAIILTGVVVTIVDGAAAFGMPFHLIGLGRWLLSLPLSIGLSLLIGAVSQFGLRRAALQ